MAGATELTACNVPSSHPAFWASGPVHTQLSQGFWGALAS